MRTRAWHWTMAVVLAASVMGCAGSQWRRQLQSEDPLDRIDGAIAAGKARHHAAVPLLVDRLEDDDEAVRMYAILALQRIEGTCLGYKYWAEPADLARMAQRWRAHVKDRQADNGPAAPATPRQDRPADAGEPAAQPRPMERTPSTQPLAQEATR